MTILDPLLLTTDHCPLTTLMHWLDVNDIAEELDATHPKVDPATLRFTELRRMVEALPGFKEEPGHACNERILETIQATWIELRESRDDGDGDDED